MMADPATGRKQAHVSLNLIIHNGFSYEQVIPITDLSADHQEYVLSQKNNADKIVIEAVYEMDSKSYEAYYYENHRLIKKIEFE
ncbi:MAG: hypothetical protein IPQ16_08575 [Geobacteraceae bacterium]|nr:hypothetical protein [Geobacteraceae bacterium]